MSSIVCIKVAELRKRGYNSFAEWAEDPNHVYIGRNMNYYVPGTLKSKWANPFKVGKDGTLEEVIEKYRHYVLSNPKLVRDLPELKGKELGCWCKPNLCHGDALVDLLK